MASNLRQSLENWLKTIDVEGNSVLDVGGIHLPVKGRTKTWLPDVYDIFDIQKYYKGREAGLIGDLNKPQKFLQYDNVFCLETLYQMYDLMEVFRNLAKATKLNGNLYLSTHFLFPTHDKTDCTRLTKQGVTVLLEKNGFKIIEIIPRITCKFSSEQDFVKGESKVNLFPGEIGYLIKAKKINELK